MPGVVRIGRFLGVPVYFAPSWIAIAAAVTVLYSALLRSAAHGVSVWASYLAAFGFALALGLCVLAHEAGHTAVSLALGHPVRRIRIYLLGGVSELEGEIERPRDELLVAVSGPLVSAALAALTGMALLFVSSGTLPYAVLALLTWSNVAVAVFNLLPGLPLDGGRALRAVVWGTSHSARTGTVVAAWTGRVLGVVLILAPWFWLATTWGPGAVLIAVASGVFILLGATRALSGLAVLERLAGLRVTDLLRSGVLVPADTSVAEAIRRARASSARGIVIVDAAGRPRAIVEENRVRDTPVERQPWTPVSAVARSLEPGLLLPSTLAGTALLEAVQAAPAGEYLVVAPDGRPAGILSAADLATALGRSRR